MELIRDADREATPHSSRLDQAVDSNDRHTRTSIIHWTSITGTKLWLLSSMTSNITFGPTDQQWHYAPAARTYDLSGGAGKKLTIATTEGPEDTLITIAPETTALVIVEYVISSQPKPPIHFAKCLHSSNMSSADNKSEMFFRSLYFSLLRQY